jgi:hypothetical protein
VGVTSVTRVTSTTADCWTTRQLAELAALASTARAALEDGDTTAALTAVREAEAVARLDADTYRTRWAEKHREDGTA